ncbi:hypothetical protein CCHR01_05115 [Colletotrichum chrysophilum]|uniref:Uncharacterized protein n=1 Tax=Colletotrichum chrysophilum TaxID=1836956 RepID=A0AAD9EL03_9PEZI|nr:hypothetical protein CCHR01_05115 [Colletotrichum chrysophilum]
MPSLRRALRPSTSAAGIREAGATLDLGLLGFRGTDDRSARRFQPVTVVFAGTLLFQYAVDAPGRACDFSVVNSP